MLGISKKELLAYVHKNPNSKEILRELFPEAFAHSYNPEYTYAFMFEGIIYKLQNLHDSFVFVGFNSDGKHMPYHDTPEEALLDIEDVIIFTSFYDFFKWAEWELFMNRHEDKKISDFQDKTI